MGDGGRGGGRASSAHDRTTRFGQDDARLAYAGIMCPLSESEQLEVATVRSLCGTLPAYGISDVPPFEAPHHTSSTAALVGGGAGVAMPGAITKAHRGVLFMDEAPEFSARSLQTLREPLESGYVAVSRSKGTAYYPAAFQLVMAANPCPCGMSYGTGERCTCTQRERQRYFARLSGPILDRIDIQVEVPPVSGMLLGQETFERRTGSAEIRARVVAARDTAVNVLPIWGGYVMRRLRARGCVSIYPIRRSNRSAGHWNHSG